MLKFYLKRNSALNFSGTAAVLFLLASLGRGLVSCDSHLVSNTTEDFEQGNGQNDNSDYFFENMGNLSEKDELFQDFDSTNNQMFDNPVTALMLIDEDKNGIVTFEELKNWLRFTVDKFIVQSVETQWTQYNEDQKDQIGWEKYRQTVYGDLNDTSKNGENDDIPLEDIEEHKEMERVEKQKWDYADENGDGFLTKLEFAYYLHLFVDCDLDGDGKVSVDEYVETIDNLVAGDKFVAVEEPDPIKQFQELRDHNGDGYLDKKEVRLWILQSYFDPIKTEAKNLIRESDIDHDGMLTIDEILVSPGFNELFHFQRKYDELLSDTVTGHDEL